MTIGQRALARYGPCRVVAVQEDGMLIQVQYPWGEVVTLSPDGLMGEQMELGLTAHVAGRE